MPTAPDYQRDFRSIIHFGPSAGYELILSLDQMERDPRRRPAWSAHARAALGPGQLAEAHFFCQDLWHPLALLELPADYSGAPDDPDGFIDYLAGMDTDTFLFYLWGRMIPREEVPAMRADRELLTRRIFDFYEATWPGSGEKHLLGQLFEPNGPAPEEIQARLVGLLRAYNERVFASELAELRRGWAASIAEKKRALAEQPPRDFFNSVSRSRPIPRMFPEGTPLREIRMIPSYYITQPSLVIWGYGTLILLYDANVTEQQQQAREQQLEEITQVASALSDKNRLKILAEIATDPDCYGHRLALLCGISQPAVSRHMGILKRAGLVEEAHSDGHVAYRLRRRTLEHFAPGLLEYLEG
ncbi:MAG: ArsR/SmtB family transcription factor [Chloroflexia bacterium]